MTISELIEKLEDIKEAEGDLKVLIQYRDDGGDYWGQDDEVRGQDDEVRCYVCREDGELIL